MQNPKLVIEDLSYSYFYNNKKIPVLSDLSMHIEQNEFVSIVGPSGCGKSTLLHMIAGIENPNSGRIHIDGKSKNRRGKCGYMLQKPLLLPWKTVKENITLGLIIRHIPQQKANEQAELVLAKFGLQEFANMYPSTLSGGMAQRVALLRTILFQNEFLLMDEPFAALDALTRIDLQTWLLSVLAEFQSTVLFITHDIREAIFLSDRIYVLSNRPASILKEMHIPFQRPRQRDILNQKKARAFEKELETLLHV